MDRRRFLSAVTAAVGGFALDPELALWTPGQRTYFDVQRALWHIPAPIEVLLRFSRFNNFENRLEVVEKPFLLSDGLTGVRVPIMYAGFSALWTAGATARPPTRPTMSSLLLTDSGTRDADGRRIFTV